MTPAQLNAIREADAYLRCAGLPTYSEVTAQPAAVSDGQRSSGKLACEMLDAYIECIKASGDYERWHYIPQVEVARDDLRAILALRPQAVPMTEQWRLLNSGDQIQAGDECLQDDCVTWLPLAGWEVGMTYNPHVLVPMRRRAEAHHGITAQAKEGGT